MGPGGGVVLCVTSKGQVFTVIYAKPLQEEQTQREGRPPAERKHPLASNKHHFIIFRSNKGLNNIRLSSTEAGGAKFIE